MSPHIKLENDWEIIKLYGEKNQMTNKHIAALNRQHETFLQIVLINSII